jgi:serpin B
MINTRGLAAGTVLATIVGLAGCGGPTDAGVRLAGHQEPIHAGSVTARQVAAANQALGWAMFRRLCRAAPTRNLTLSPASAAEALGLLDAGASGQTRSAVTRLLHLPAWSPALVAALHDQTAALAQVSQVTVTNHVWEQEGLTPTGQTLNDLQTAYAADVRQVDFGVEPGTTDTINSVISHDTDGLIPTLFGQPLDSSTQTVLADALLLDAKWQQPFPSSAPGSFRTATGSNVTTALMDNSEGDVDAREAAGWQSVVLPYTGHDLQALAVLPPVGSAACATPSAATLSSLTTGTTKDDGVVLPKLDLSQTLDLTELLAKLGLPLSGDYSGLGVGDRQISDVVQKVVMRVDQAGTKAAAATGIAIASSARAGNDVVTFNRPFLLLLEDTATHTPLFLARVADPSQP